MTVLQFRLVLKELSMELDSRDTMDALRAETPEEAAETAQLIMDTASVLCNTAHNSLNLLRFPKNNRRVSTKKAREAAAVQP